MVATNIQHLFRDEQRNMPGGLPVPFISVPHSPPIPSIVRPRRFDVDRYHDGKLMRDTFCRFRTNGQKPIVIATNRLDRGNCAYQSPVIGTDPEQNTNLKSAQTGGTSYETAYIGVFQQFWSNQSGESGVITNKYAHGLGLYSYENRKTPSALDPDSARTAWVSELVYARINGVSFGMSLLESPPTVFGPSS